MPSAFVAAKQCWNNKKRTLGKFAVGGTGCDVPFALHALYERELIAVVEVSSFECFARGAAHVIMQRPAYGGVGLDPWDGIAAGGCELRVSGVVHGSKADEETRTVFQNLECVSALDRQQVVASTLFGSGFEETMQQHPLLGVGGLLADRDHPSSPGCEAYHVDRLGGNSQCLGRDP